MSGAERDSQARGARSATGRFWTNILIIQQAYDFRFQVFGQACRFGWRYVGCSFVVFVPPRYPLQPAHCPAMVVREAAFRGDSCSRLSSAFICSHWVLRLGSSQRRTKGHGLASALRRGASPLATEGGTESGCGGGGESDMADTTQNHAQAFHIRLVVEQQNVGHDEVI